MSKDVHVQSSKVGGAVISEVLVHQPLHMACRGLYNPASHRRLLNICRDCYNLFREAEVFSMCTANCFDSPFFLTCAKALLMELDTVVKDIVIVG